MISLGSCDSAAVIAARSATVIAPCRACPAAVLIAATADSKSADGSCTAIAVSPCTWLTVGMMPTRRPPPRSSVATRCARFRFSPPLGKITSSPHDGRSIRKCGNPDLAQLAEREGGLQRGASFLKMDVHLRNGLVTHDDNAMAKP